MLAQSRTAAHHIVPLDQFLAGEPITNLLHRTPELDLDQVRFPRSQKLLHVKAAADEHIVHPAQFLPIQEDRRHGIDTLKHEIDPLLAQHRRIDLELVAISEIQLLEMLEAEFVPAPVRVGNQPVIKQVRMGAARHFGSQPAAGFGFEELPVGEEGLMNHNSEKLLFLTI